MVVLSNGQEGRQEKGGGGGIYTLIFRSPALPRGLPAFDKCRPTVIRLQED